MIPADATTPLSGGGTIPLIGFGTYKLTGRSCEAAVRAALDAGYRHVDTATMYGNEDRVGRALAASGIDRDEVFVTTKLWPDDAGRARQVIEQSRRALAVDQLDLWLIHWPPGGARPDVWDELRRARDDGLTRCIGVSNYSIDQIDELVAATGEAPAVNQIEFGPARFDAALLAAHRDRGVVVEGWSPFRSTNLRDAALTGIAAAHGVSVQQVIVRWHLQHEVVVIPKSGKDERIRANRDVSGFTLDDAQMAAIDALGR